MTTGGLFAIPTKQDYVCHIKVRVINRLKKNEAIYHLVHVLSQYIGIQIVWTRGHLP